MWESGAGLEIESVPPGVDSNWAFSKHCGTDQQENEKGVSSQTRLSRCVSTNLGYKGFRVHLCRQDRKPTAPKQESPASNRNTAGLPPSATDTLHRRESYLQGFLLESSRKESKELGAKTLATL